MPNVTRLPPRPRQIDWGTVPINPRPRDEAARLVEAVQRHFAGEIDLNAQGAWETILRPPTPPKPARDLKKRMASRAGTLHRLLALLPCHFVMVRERVYFCQPPEMSALPANDVLFTEMRANA